MKGRMIIFTGKQFPSIVNFVKLFETSGITSRSTISNRRNFSKSPVLTRFRSYESPGSYTKGRDLKDVFQEIYSDPKAAFEKTKRVFREEFTLWYKEHEPMHFDEVKQLGKEDIDMLFTFDHDNCLDKWIVTTDKTNNQGFSTATFVRSNSETALFSGNIVTNVPKDGKTKYAGFASILTKRLLKSFKRFDTYQWEEYTHLVLKIRGDGRTYLVILGCPDRYDQTWQDQFHYPLFTRGGPYWQLVKIPFSNFYFTSKGRVQDSQFTMPLTSCSRVGLTLADGIDGPFRLEIEYFGLEFQPYHKAICPYEEYYLGKNVAD